MLRCFILAGLLLLAQTGSSATILVLGDSLSAAYGLRVQDGWVALLEKQHPQHQWVNASISGETTAGGLARIGDLLQTHEPDVLVIELGANDGLRGQLPGLAAQNLQAIIAQGKAADARILLLGIRLPPNYGQRYTRALADIYPKLANDNATAVVPFFLEAIADNPAYFQQDQLHPTAAAQPLIAQTVWPALEQILQSLPEVPSRP